MRTILYRWASANRVILTNASSLVSSQLITSALGFGYWWLAARLFAPNSVGLASAAISAMMLLGTASILGLGTLLLGEIPRQRERAPALISTALLVAGGAGLLVGLLAAWVAPLVSPDLAPLSASLGSALLFAMGVSLTSVTLVLDQAVIGLLRGSLQLWRNIVFAGVKLLVLAAFGLLLADRFGLTIYASWVIGGLVSVAYLGVLTAHRTGRKRDSHAGRFRMEWDLLKRLSKSALGHHALNLAVQVPGLTLPVLVTAMLGASANAHFYIAWMVAAFVFVVPYSLTTVLYAVSSPDPALLAHKMRHTLALSLAIGAAANVVLLLGAGLVLELFGRGYAEQAAWSLRVLALGVFPLIVRYHYIAVSRVYGRVIRASLLMVAGGALELTLAAVGGLTGGLIGLTLGWLAAVCVEALFMSSLVYKASRTDASTGVHLSDWQPPTPLAPAGRADSISVDARPRVGGPRA